jgi:hypothetical protein
MRDSASLAFFLLLAIVHTWPLAERPAVHSRVDNGDYNLNVWAVDWVARTLPTDPAHLFDGNIFYPAKRTLAYSEPLILQGLLAIPFTWSGVPAVATHNLVVLLGFALTGWAFALLVHRRTGSWLAGLIAGSAVAFNAHHLVRITHVQALHLELVPLVFVALDRLVVTGRLRYAAWTGALVAAQAAASIYLLVFTAWAAACAWLARVHEWRGRGTRTVIGIAVAVAAFVLLLLPILWPYAALARGQGMLRTLEETQRCTAGWEDYLFTGSRLHFDAWSRRFSIGNDALFPGIIVTLLAGWALVADRGRDARVRMWAAAALGSVLLSVLPHLPGFPWLHERVPLLGAIRCYSRAGQMALVALGVLAGFGTAIALRRMRSPRAAAAAGIVLLILVNGEALRAPLVYQEFGGIPQAYRILRDEPHAIVAEMPFYGGPAIFDNSIYMVYATYHRHPILNGYSGFAPTGFGALAEVMFSFPEARALEAMRKLGVTHVVVHRNTPQMRRRREAIAAAPSLRLLVEEEGVALFRLMP